MWKRIALFTLNLLVSIAIFAGNGSLEIRLVSNNEIQIDPGSTFCVAVTLINYEHTDKEFLLKIKTPTGWNQIMKYSSEVVKASTKELKIFSFFVPNDALVGDYSIYITALNRSDNEEIGTVKVPIYVKPRYEILTQTMNPPAYAFSGDTLSVRFLLRNSSNVAATLKTTVVNNRKSETRNITLDHDQSQVIRILVTTPKNIVNNTTANVKLSASIMGAPKVKSTSICVFNVIPSDKSKFDAYHRVPVKISGMLATNNPNGERSYGYMYDIKGGGEISPEKKRSLYFHFRGPNRQGNPVLGQTDEYNAKYFTPNTRLVVGDNSFSLTALTEASRMGRGVSYVHKFKKISLGGFVNFPRFYPGMKRVISASGTYSSSEKLSLTAGFLTKTFVNDSSAELMTVSGEISPFKWNSEKFEYAMGMAGGKTTKAYSFGLRIHHSPYQLFIDYTRADPHFPGYLSNTEYVSSGLGVTVFHKINLSFNYFFNHSNMALDTMYANAPYSSQMVVSAGYRFNVSTGMSLSVSKNKMEDMSTPKQFFFSEKTMRLTFSTRIKRIGIDLYSSFGQTTNYLKPKENELPTKTVMNTHLSTHYKINNHLNFTFFVSYLGGQQFINSNFKKYFYGGTFNAEWGSKFQMSFQYQNNYEVQEYYKNRSLVGLVGHYRIGKQNEIGIFINYGLKKDQINRTQISALLNVTHKLNFPVSKRKDIGSLQGKIINQGVTTIEGIRIRMAGNVAYTDKNGEFSFQNVKTGFHYLFIDNSKAGIDAIAVKPGPYKVDILPGIETRFVMPLTKAGEIKGKVTIKEDNGLSRKEYVTAKAHLKRLIVEVKDSVEVFRVYTKPDGSFDFTDLRPGTWRLKVYKSGIPEGYKLETSEFTVHLNSEEIKQVKVIVKKIYQKIQFQQNSWTSNN